VSNFDEKTRVTQIVQPIGADGADEPRRTDCLVVIYTKEPTLLGKRFVLDPAGKPMEFARVLYRSDRFTLTLALEKDRP